jgi:hypothetical protein
MQKRLETLQVFLLIAASFLVLGFSAYFQCCNLARLDFRSPDVSLENPEEDNTGINHICELKISKFDGCSDVPLFTSIPKQSPLIDFLKPRLDQETIALRC